MHLNKQRNEQKLFFPCSLPDKFTSLSPIHSTPFIPTPDIIPNHPISQFLTPRGDSDGEGDDSGTDEDEDEETEQEKQKRMPEWARGAMLKEALEKVRVCVGWNGEGSVCR